MVANDPSENKIYNHHKASEKRFRTPSSPPQSMLVCNMVNYLLSENREISHWKLGTITQKYS